MKQLGGRAMLGLPAGAVVLDICTFRGTLIVATDQGAYREVDGRLELIRFPSVLDEAEPPRSKREAGFHPSA